MISVVIPAKNEAMNIGPLLEDIQRVVPDAEILVVDDGSSDDTAAIARAKGATVLQHPYSKGNGAAVKTGARAATGGRLLIMDGDGQHPAQVIPTLIAEMDRGFDMVVGARNPATHASMARRLANHFYNRAASLLTEHEVEDLTSGFRLVDTEKFREFLYLLPNGFSSPTTITMAFFRAGYSVCYTPYDAAARIGNSHIKPIRDGVRFLLIIFKVATLYSPLKIFFPVSVAQLLLAMSYYLYIYVTSGRLTNMVVILLVSATTTFLVGLLSEQITTLIYKRH